MCTYQRALLSDQGGLHPCSRGLAPPPPPPLPCPPLSHSPTLRSWPGNPTGGDNVLSTQCWDPSKVVRVRIVDSCPCKQVYEWAAEGGGGG